MPAFFSIDGKLTLPNAEHPPDKDYAPVEVGKPLCVEMIHLGFGDVKDWWGQTEILVSSWSKTGGTAKAGVRLVNLMRTGIKGFEHLSDWGAAEYGHQLMHYTPAYNGEVLRLSAEFLEIDKLGAKGVATLGKALQKLGALPVFAPQLGYLALAPQALELARRLYNLFNQNDLVLLQHLDLAFKEPGSNILSSGRYVLVHGNHDPAAFMDKFTLGTDNRLRTKDGKLAGKAVLDSPYLVIRVNAVERKGYQDFVLDSEAQVILDAVLAESKTLSEGIANVLVESVKLSKEYGSVQKVLELKKKLDKTKDEDKKAKLKTAIANELKLIGDDQAELIKDALALD